MKKKSFKILLLSLIITSLLPIKIFAAGTTILPKVQEELGGKSVEQFCEDSYLIYLINDNDQQRMEEIYLKQPPKWQESFLSCAVSLGLVHLWMIPYFLVYWTESLLQIAGIIAVLMFVLGGLFYVLGGVSETITKEKGKTTMKWALTGMALSFLSWVIVNVVIYFVSQ